MLVYCCSIKIHALGLDKLLGSIFSVLLVTELFSLQKVVKMFEEVVVGWQEVRRIQQMRQNFIAQLVQLLRHWLWHVWSGTVLEKNRPFLLASVGFRRCSFQCISSICWAYFSDGIVSPGSEIYSGSEGQQPTRDPDLFFCVQIWHWEVLWSFFWVQPLSWSSPAVMWNLLFITSHNPIKKWFVVVQNKRRWCLKTKIFLICHQLMRHPLIELFTFPICFKCWMTAIWSKLSYLGNFLCSCKKFSFSVALSWWLATSDGCQLCSSSSRLLSPLQNFLLLLLI